MDRHLIAVEVGVERGTHQWMQLNCLTFYQYWLECLDAQPMQGRSPIQHYWMLPNNILQNIPYDRTLIFHLPLGCLYGAGNAHYFQFVENEGFEQFQCHFLRQTALMQFELGTYDNHRAPGVIYPFPQKILTEATALAFDHIGKRF